MILPQEPSLKVSQQAIFDTKLIDRYTSIIKNYLLFFFLGVVNFNAKHGCLKCTTIGEYSHASHTVYFSRSGCPERTDEGFRNRIYERHHKIDSPLEELQIDMVRDIPVGDSLHLIDLGVMKRFLVGWKEGNFGNYSTKWCARDIQQISDYLIKCKMPSEIHRAVRSLDVLAYWKGTEYRTFLFYIGIVILKKFLAVDVYHHFLLLFCAITICSTKAFTHFLPLAESLLEEFVETYRDFYGEHYMTANVHNLSHLVSEVKIFGVLSTFNAYPFENRLFQIKTLLRSGNCPLAQVAKRISEIADVDRCQDGVTDNFPKLTNMDKNRFFTTIQFKEFCLNSKHNKDKWFLTLKNEIVSIKNAVTKNNLIIIFGYPVDKKSYFETPISSSRLNIFESYCNKQPLKQYLLSDVKCKLVFVQDIEKVVFIPLLHSYQTK